MSERKKPSNNDFGFLLRDVHEQDTNVLRISEANREVPVSFTKVDLTTNAEGSVTKAVFWRGETPEITRIATISDSAGSLNNKYFFINSAEDNYLFYVWFNVSGVGVDPAIPGRIGLRIDLNSNDPAVVVALAIQLILNNLDHFKVERNGNILIVTNVANGYSSSANSQNSGFTITMDQTGTSDKVKTVLLPYQNGIKYIYNTIERKFELINGSFTGEFRPRGLNNGGKVSEVELTDTEWRPIPGTALTLRNAMSIQNRDNLGEANPSAIKLRYDLLGSEGTFIVSGGDKFYDITDDIVIYGRTVTGTFTVNVEELS